MNEYNCDKCLKLGIRCDECIENHYSDLASEYEFSMEKQNE